MKIEIDMDKPSMCAYCPFFRPGLREGSCIILEVNTWYCGPDITCAEYDTPDECPFNKEDDE